MRLSLLCLLVMSAPAAVGQGAPPWKTRPRDYTNPWDFVDPRQFAPGDKGLVDIINDIASRRDQTVKGIDAVTKKYNGSGNPDYNRWGWLSVSRAAIARLDREGLEADGLAAEFWGIYSTFDPQPDPLETHLNGVLRRFYMLQIEHRKNWYYDACTHRWSWELDRNGRPLKDWRTSPDQKAYTLTYKAFVSTCKFLGCTTDQGYKFLAWVDLYATYLLPGCWSQILTIPFGLAS